MLRHRLLRIVLVLAALLALPGCWVYSVHPLAESDSDLIFDKALLGTWAQPDEGCALTISRLSEERAYNVIYTAPMERKLDGCLLDPGKTASFKAGVVEVGGKRFLDLYPADRDNMHHMLRLHSFYRLTVEPGALSLTRMNREWLHEQAASRALPVVTREDSDGFVLTSATRELRAFLESYGDNDQLFDPATRLHFKRKAGF